MARQQPAEFGAVAQTEVFPQVVRFHRPPGNHRRKPAAGMALAGALRQQEIAHHHDLLVFGRVFLRMPRDAHAAGGRKPLRHQAGEVGRSQPCPLGHRAVLHGSYCQNRSQHMPVETEVIVDGGVGRAAAGQRAIGRGRDALVRQFRRPPRRQQ